MDLGSLRLYLCGPFRITGADEETARLRTRKTESLLAYLALNRGAWRTRDELVDLFWTDESPAEAKPKLRLALHSIRKVVGDALETQGEGLRIVELWVDALDEDPRELVSAWILAGRYEDWTTPFQVELERRVEAACLTAYRESESASEKIAGLMALVRAEPLNSKYYEALYRALEKEGSFAAARAIARSAMVALGSDCPDQLRKAIGSVSGPAPDLVLAELAYDLLGQEEPVVRSLVGPAGIGKTYTARQLMRAARDEEIESHFVSLADHGSESVESTVAGLLADRFGAVSVDDLPPILLILDNAEDVADSELDFLSRTPWSESSLRTLVTTQRATGDGIIRMPVKSLPATNSSADLESAETARLIAEEMDRSVDEIDSDLLFRAARSTGGLPLAIKLVARDLQYGRFEDAGQGRDHLSERLRRSYSRLGEANREALARLMPLRPGFHIDFVELVDVDRESVRELHEECWISPTGELGAFEILPPVRRFLREQCGSELPVDFVERVGRRSRELVRSNYRELIQVFDPSIQTIDELVEKLLAEERREEAALLYPALFFCYHRNSNVDRPIAIGRRIYGEGPEFEISDALNLFGNACFFGKRHELAERVYETLLKSNDPAERSLGKANLGLIYLNRGEGAKSIEPLRQAAEEPGITLRQRVTRLNNLAKGYAVDSRFELARETAHRALELCGEDEALVVLRAVLYFSLAEIETFGRHYDEAAEWAVRSYRMFSDSGDRLRRLEAGFLWASSIANAGDKRRAVELGAETMPRPDFAAPHWAPNAACLLVSLGDERAVSEILGDFDLTSQPNWVQSALAESGLKGGPVRLTNKERFIAFRDAMKRV